MGQPDQDVLVGRKPVLGSFSADFDNPAPNMRWLAGRFQGGKGLSADRVDIRRLAACRLAAALTGLRDRGSGEFRRLHRGHIEQSLDHLWLLRARDRVAARHDEARHSIDAEPVCTQVVGVHRVGLFVARQEAT